MQGLIAIWRNRLAGFSAVALAVFSCCEAEAFERGNALVSEDNPRLGRAAPLHGEAALAHLKEQGTYQSLTQAIEAAKYSIDQIPLPGNESGAFRAFNSAQALQAEFTGDGTVVRSNGQSSWQLRLNLKSYGDPDHLVPVVPAATKVVANRIELTRRLVGSADAAALVEWFVNTPSGLEQGFTLFAPPS